jgi:hypothetical protein
MKRVSCGMVMDLASKGEALKAARETQRLMQALQGD